MNAINEINNKIKEYKDKNLISTKNVSDSHHTFKDLYEQRTILFSVICNFLPDISWKSKKHYDEENDPMFEGDFIAGINTPKGIASYHIKLKYWDLFQIPEIDRAPKYDNYTCEDVLNRLQSLINKERKDDKRFLLQDMEKFHLM